jgi:PAS domain S-box-containing protein
MSAKREHPDSARRDGMQASPSKGRTKHAGPEEALCESERPVGLRSAGEFQRLKEFSESIAETMGEVVLLIDPNGLITSANPRVQALLGYAPEELTGRHWATIVPADQYPVLEDADVRRARGEPVGPYDLELVHHEDHRVFVNVSATPRQDPVTGRFAGMRAVMTDITERRQVEKLLRIQRDLAIALNSTTSLHEALELVLTAAMQNEGIDCGGIYLVDEATGALHLAVHRNLSAQFLESESHLPPDSPHARFVAEGTPTYWSSPPHEYSNDVLKREGIRAVASIPIRSADRIVAALNVASHVRDDFAAPAREALESIGAQIGGVIVRARAIEALGESARRYATLAAVIPVGIIRTDAGGNCVYANERWCELVGMSAAQVQGVHWSVAVPPEERALIEDAWACALREDRLLSLEHRFRRPDGTSTWVLGQALAERDAKANITGYVGTATDITDRKRDEEALRESEERFRHVVENVSEVLWLTDWWERKLLYVNPSYETVYGRSRQSLFKDRRSWIKAIHPEDRARVDRVFAEKGERGEYTEEEYRIVRPDGDTRWVRDSSFPIRDASGQVYRWVGVAEDITARKLAEESLRASEARFRRVVEHISDALIVDDVAGRVVFANDRFLALFGFDRKDLSALMLEDYVAPEHRKELRERHDRRIRGEPVPTHFEYEGIRRDGGRLWLEVDVAPLVDAAGRTTGTQSAIRDITERKRAEEALRQEQERLALAQCAGQVGVFDWDPLSDRRIWTPQLDALYGMEPGSVEHTSEDWARRVHPDDLAEAQAAIQQCFRERRPELENDYRIVRPDGEVRWLANRARVTYDAAGKPVRVVGTCADITERKRAEAEREKLLLRQQGVSHLRQLLLAPVPLEAKLKSVTDGIVRLLDADFCRIWLIRPGDLCERGCIHAEVHEGPHVCRHRDRCLHLLASSGRYTHVDGPGHRRVPFGCYKIGRVASDEEPRFLTNDVPNDPRVHNHDWARELGLVSFAGYRLRAPKGDTLGVLALFAKHPISADEDAMLNGLGSTVALTVQQATAEEAVRESEERFRATFEQAAVGIAHVTPEGRFLRVNQGYADIVGYTPEELRQHTFQDVTHPEDLAANVAAVRQLLAGKTGAYSLEKRYVRKNGALVWGSLTVSAARDAQGRCEYLIGVVQDITARKEAEAARVQAEQRFTQVLENVSAAAVILSSDECITYCNPYLLELTGWSDAEVRGRNWFELFIPADQRERVRAMFEAGMCEDRLAPHYENNILTRDGRRRLISWSNTALYDAAGRVIGLASLGYDITERRRAEEAVWIERAKLLGILEAMDDAVCIIDQQYQIVYTNPAFLQQFGPVEGRLCYEYFHGRSDACPWCRSARVFASESLRWESSAERNGRAYDVFETALRNEDGTLSKLDIYHDVTARREAEAALVSRTRELETVMESTPNAIARLDHELRYMFVNRRWVELNGLSPEAARGRTPGELHVYGESCVRLEETLRQVLAERRTREVEFVARTAAGERRLQVHALPEAARREGPEANTVLTITRDVTEERRLQEELNQAQKMEVVGQLATGVAHDINNVLTAISGYAALARAELPPGHQTGQSLDQVEEAVLQAAGVVRGLLTFSHKMPVNRQTVDLRHVLAEAARFVKRMLPAAIEVVLEGADGPPLWVSADGAQLQQVILNLAVNARDAMPDGGTLRFALRADEAGHGAAERPGRSQRFVRLVVSDTGEGIPPEVLPHIFEPFFTTKPPGQGTGLGLATIKSVVEQHGGEVQVHSIPGGGAQFTISLPCTEPPSAAEPERTEATRARARGELILVADDNVQVRDVISAGLRQIGYDVVAVGDAPAIHTECARCGSRVKLAILDVDLPGGSGVDALRAIRQVWPALPAAIITGDMDSDLQSSEDGRTCLLEKPFLLDDLLGVVAELLEQQTGAEVVL